MCTCGFQRATSYVFDCVRHDVSEYSDALLLADLDRTADSLVLDRSVPLRLHNMDVARYSEVQTEKMELVRRRWATAKLTLQSPFRMSSAV